MEHKVNIILCVLDVALLAEGVDRNRLTVFVVVTEHQSPSSRRAWIEISGNCSTAGSSGVALLAEGVDRNYNAKAVEVSTPSHPPCRGYR